MAFLYVLVALPEVVRSLMMRAPVDRLTFSFTQPAAFGTQ